MTPAQLAAVIPVRTAPPPADPYRSNVILLVGYGDFTDRSPLLLGTASPTGESVDAGNQLGGISSILCGGAGGQIAEWANSLPNITLPAIFEIWLKCGIPGNIYSHPILSGRNSSHVGPFYYVTGPSSISGQWSFSKDSSTQIVQTAQSIPANTWTYTAMLVDTSHSVAHIGLVGGNTTPGALQGGGNATIPTGPHWATGQDTSDSAAATLSYAGNYAQIRITQNTTRGLVITNDGLVGVSYPVPSLPFPLP